MKEYIIRTMQPEDIPAVMDIIREAQRSLKALGISQWQNGYPNEEAFQRDIKNRIGYVLAADDRIAATAAISFAPDPTYGEIYEGAWLTEGAYGVIHRIAVRTEYKRSGYAAELVSFAKKLARQQEKQIQSLRIDTHEGNLPMRGFLRKEGFEECGIIYLREEKTPEDRRIAYELKI